MLLLIEHGSSGSTALLMERRTGALMGPLTLPLVLSRPLTCAWLSPSDDRRGHLHGRLRLCGDLSTMARRHGANPPPAPSAHRAMRARRHIVVAQAKQSSLFVIHDVDDIERSTQARPLRAGCIACLHKGIGGTSEVLAGAGGAVAGRLDGSEASRGGICACGRPVQVLSGRN